MRLAALFSGGKDSTYALFLAKKFGHTISCLISISSANPDSYMFHTPSIYCVKMQSKALGIPLIFQHSKGIKEAELADLKKAILAAKKRYRVEGVVTGAVESVYQASRIQKICNSLGIEVFNPLWQKDQIDLLEELVKNRFEIAVTAVAAHPLDGGWLGRLVDKKFIQDALHIKERHGINPAGEGGEFETLVLNCPMFRKKLEIKDRKVAGSGNAWNMEVTLG